MKFIFIFSALLILEDAKAVPRSVKMLQTAFEKIAESLPKNGRLVSVVSVGEGGMKESAAATAFAGILHNLVAWKQTENFRLNFSAIVTLGSVEWLRIFNKRTILPFTYSM